MSHFSVLVIGDDVEGQLAPYHEFECTGTDDKYVQAVDITAKARAEYESGTARRLRDPQGVLYEPWSEQFFREPTTEELAKIGPIAGSGFGHGVSWTSKDREDGRGYRTKIAFIPDGWEEVTVTRSEVESFAEWAKDWYGLAPLSMTHAPDLAEIHKYGWMRLDRKGNVVELVDRTNPNAKWDWYEIGGRWKGFFRIKAHLAASGEVAEVERTGEPATSCHWKADQSIKGRIDFEGMRNEADAEARTLYQRVASIIAGRSIPVWREMIGEKPAGEHIKAMREEYGKNPVIRDLRKSDLRHIEPADFAVTEDEYAARAADRAVRTFAVVKDGQWYEKGSMGWWGMVSDEKGEEEWGRQYAALLDSLPDDTLLTIVDCHI